MGSTSVLGKLSSSEEATAKTLRDGCKIEEKFFNFFLLRKKSLCSNFSRHVDLGRRKFRIELQGLDVPRLGPGADGAGRDKGAREAGHPGVAVFEGGACVQVLVAVQLYVKLDT